MSFLKGKKAGNAKQKSDYQKFLQLQVKEHKKTHIPKI